MPLPSGWTATLEREWIDRSHAPPHVVMEFVFTSPDGASLRHGTRIERPDVVGLNRQGRVNVAWTQMGQYVTNAIADLVSMGPPPPPVNNIDVQVAIP